jgi:glycerophosphoryl diester phosphodiesterase
VKLHLRVIFAIAVLLLAGCATQIAPSKFAQAEQFPVLLAHRGVSQTFSAIDIQNDTCTATRIYPPVHTYLENTIASMQTAFNAGEHIVEIDIHPTTDGQFAVFHDWTLECRTNGKGRTRDFAMADLKKLDLGYGYSADGGKTFPLRGTTTEKMPSLQEVLKQFTDKRFLINIKSNDPEEGRLLANFLNNIPRDNRSLLAVYGGQKPLEVVRSSVPDIITMSNSSLKDCLLKYLAIGWTGYVPASCHSHLIFIPYNYAHLFWGWPHTFNARMQSVGSAVFIAGPYESGEASRGIDTVAELGHIPNNYRGGVWTNEIQRIGKAVQQQKYESTQQK